MRRAEDEVEWLNKVPLWRVGEVSAAGADK